MVLFGVLSLFLTSQRRWFLAGLCGSLSFLLWQPTAIFPLVTLFLAAMQPRERRSMVIVRTLAGILLPLVAVGAYFHYHGAFHRLLDGSILFHIFYGDRPERSLLEHFLEPMEGASEGYPTMIPAILIGLVMVVYTILLRWVRHRSFRAILAKDAFGPILLSFPALILWSLLDFQNRKDFFVLLPYVAIGFGSFLDLAVRRIGRLEGAALPRGTQRFLTVGLCISLVALAVANEALGPMDTRREEFDQQRQAATEIEDRFGNDAKLVSIGTPELLVLQHRTNPTPYGFISRGIANHIDANTPGGFEGWVRELESYNPDVIAVEGRGSTRNRELMNWVNSSYREERIGPWTLYVRNSIEE